MSKNNTSRAGLTIASVLLASSALVACSSDIEEAITALIVTAELSSIQSAVFEDNCVGCHNNNNQAGGLNLADGVSFTSLVGVGSTQVTGVDLVVAGDAVNSYLVQKIENADGIVGTQMPPSGALPSAAIDAIKDWINGGALDN